MRELIDQASRLRLLESIAFAEVLRSGITRGNALAPAFTAFLRAASDRRELLRLLGLQRVEKVETLNDYLASLSEQHAEQHEQNEHGSEGRGTHQ